MFKEQQDDYVIPAYPNSAFKFVERKLEDGRRIFSRPMPQNASSECKNCVDLGQIYLSVARAGPFTHVPGHRKGESLTWFDGDGKSRKGWYIIVETLAFSCPWCQPKDQDELQSDWWQDG